MGDNFFLDGTYSQKQIDSINNVKAKKAAQSAKEKQSVSGDISSIFNDINTYKSDSTKKTNNSDLFDYIDQTMGMDNFLEMLDADGDGKISEEEAKELSSLDSDDALSDSDIDKLADDIKALSSAKKIAVSDNSKSETEYKADSTGKLIKTSSKTMNKDTDEVNAEYTYDEKGNILTKIDKLKNNKITYEYTTDASGKTTKKSTTVNIPTNTTIARHTYNENGKVETKEDVINNRTTKYSYDASGNTIGAEIFNTKTGETTAVDKYENNKRVSRENKIANTVTSYTYDASGILTSNKVTTSDGKLKSESNYYTSGEYKGKVKDKKEYYSPTTGLKCNSFWTYDKYDKQGRILERTHYAGGSASGQSTKFQYNYATDKYSTRPISRKNTKTNEMKFYTYNEYNELTDVEYKDKDNKLLYSCKVNKDGTYASRTKGGKITLFEYSKGGIRTKAIVYNASDIVDGKPKAGAKPISTVEYSDGVKSKNTLANGESTEYDKDGNKTKTTSANDDVTEYDAKGNKTKTTSKKGDITYFENNKKTKTEFANGNVTFYKDDNVSVEIEGDKAYVYTYNSNGTKTRTEYTANGINKKTGEVKPTADVIGEAILDKNGNVIKEKDKDEDDEKYED